MKKLNTTDKNKRLKYFINKEFSTHLIPFLCYEYHIWHNSHSVFEIRLGWLNKSFQLMMFKYFNATTILLSKKPKTND